MANHSQLTNYPLDLKQIRSEYSGLDNSVNWRGRSGKIYRLIREKLADFALLEQDIYIILSKGQPFWVGTAADLIANEYSRERFREAIIVADNVLRLKDNSDDITKMNIIWDIEKGQLIKGSKLAKIKLFS